VIRAAVDRDTCVPVKKRMCFGHRRFFPGSGVAAVPKHPDFGFVRSGRQCRSGRNSPASSGGWRILGDSVKWRGVRRPPAGKHGCCDLMISESAGRRLDDAVFRTQAQGRTIGNRTHADDPGNSPGRVGVVCVGNPLQHSLAGGGIVSVHPEPRLKRCQFHRG